LPTDLSSKIDGMAWRREASIGHLIGSQVFVIVESRVLATGGASRG
jgi:hypothetical protein